MSAEPTTEQAEQVYLAALKITERLLNIATTLLQSEMLEQGLAPAEPNSFIKEGDRPDGFKRI